MDKAKAKKIFWIAAGSLVAIFLVVGLIRYGAIFAFFMVYPWILSHITDTFLNENIAKAIAIGATVILLITVRYLILFQPKVKQILGYSLLTGMVIAHLLFVASVTKEQYFSVWTGQAQKYYTVNPIDGTINVFEKPVHDLFGTKAKPITSAVARDIAIQKRSNKPQTEIPSHKIVNFFDPYSGANLIWFTKHDDGSYHFFMRPGFDPKTGKKLSPITKDAMAEYLKPVTVTPKTYAARLDDRSLQKASQSRESGKLGIPLKLVSYAGFYQAHKHAQMLIDGNYEKKVSAKNCIIVVSFNEGRSKFIEEVVFYTHDDNPIDLVKISYTMKKRPNQGMIEIGAFKLQPIRGPQFINLYESLLTNSDQDGRNFIEAMFMRFDFYAESVFAYLYELDILETEIINDVKSNKKMPNKANSNKANSADTKNSAAD